jgi:DNA-binding NarL/FixJ family response regulator
VLLSDDSDVPRLLATGVLPGWACLRKEADAPEIAGAVRAVAAGLIALEAAIVRQFLAAHTASTPVEAETSNGVLTSREREVLQLMAEGLPNKIIAARLHISQHTVKFHVASILSRLGASSRTEAVTLGVRYGYILL